MSEDGPRAAGRTVARAARSGSVEAISKVERPCSVSLSATGRTRGELAKTPVGDNTQSMLL
jgi:hypothetical protein